MKRANLAVAPELVASYVSGMPEISRFLGIVIAIYYRDHSPPHFHAVYREFEATSKSAAGLSWARSRNERSRTYRGGADYTSRSYYPYGTWLRPICLCRGSNPWSESVLLHIVEAEYVGDYRIRLRFDDGVEGEVDLADELTGPVFQPLRSPSAFRRFRVHPELRTLVWPNGADFAPEFLRRKLTLPA